MIKHRPANQIKSNQIKSNQIFYRDCLSHPSFELESQLLPNFWIFSPIVILHMNFQSILSAQCGFSAVRNVTWFKFANLFKEISAAARKNLSHATIFKYLSIITILQYQTSDAIYTVVVETDNVYILHIMLNNLLF